jgi:hypothetical protein
VQSSTPFASIIRSAKVSIGLQVRRRREQIIPGPGGPGMTES